MVPVEHLKTVALHGVTVEIFQYLYKGKDPVWYSFEENEIDRAICISIDSALSCEDITQRIIRNRKDKLVVKSLPKKLTCIQMKIFKLI